ncbi:hypothetical protein ASC95_09865 [Pelomonas sp. Root1217]|uniref:hypothetical protein n=1 Tax=Pelomonas sp. Root1217 TaxID=1736430 RepID=UPI00070C739B|nr:hypothetical protein [Pelomonas sp. Root1217]KQV53065.1 hypothetical protein ASC95_09865 [Pelomonas sp. Root1217]
MAEPDAFDPTHALDGWRPPAPAPISLQDLTLGALPRSDGDGQGRAPRLPLVRAETVAFDPTHLLDGWRPPAPAPLDLELKSLVRAGRSGPDEAKKARLKARGYEMLDVEDIELPEAPAPRVVVARLVREATPAPPLAEAESVAPPVSEVPPAPPPEAADVEPPPEASWPLFTAEAQVLEEASAPTEPDAVDSPEAPPLTAEAAWLDLRFEPPQTVEDGGALAEPPPATAGMHEGEAVEVAPPDADAAAVPVDLTRPVQNAEVPAGPAPGDALMADVEVPEAPEAFAPEPTPFVEIVESINEPQPIVAQAPESSIAPLPPEPVLAEGADPLGNPAPSAVEAPEAPEAPEAVMPELEPSPVYPQPGPIMEVVELIDEPLQPAAAQALESSSASLPTAPALVKKVELLEIPPLTAVEAVVSEPEPEPESPVVEFVPEPLIEPVEPPDEPLEPAVAQMPEPPSAPLPPTPAVAQDAGPLDTPPVAVEPPELDFRALPPPAPPDPRALFDDIRLTQVPPPPAVVEAPVLDFRAPPPSPQPDPQQVIDEIEMPKVLALPTAIEAPVLDMQALASRSEPSPRLVAEWQPQAWTVLAQHVADASTEVSRTAHGLHVVNHAAQWLCALWPPQDKRPALLARWPEMAALVGAATRAEALESLLEALPDEAKLWLGELEADWGLVAELVLHQDTGLRPAQIRALRDLAEAERNASLARLNAGYQSQGRVARRKP